MSERTEFDLPISYVCTMTPKEANKRIRAAKKVDGVNFSFHGDGEKASRGRVVGETLVESSEGLNEFNKILRMSKDMKS